MAGGGIVFYERRPSGSGGGGGGCSMRPIKDYQGPSGCVRVH